MRAHQYVPAFADAGWAVRTWSFLREPDLAAFFGPSQVRRALRVLRALPRVVSGLLLACRADVVLVQREALPFGPPLLERVAARTGTLVWDVDDAVWEHHVSPTAGRVPLWLRAPGDKYGRVCAWADEVWAGSAVLADWCRRRNPATTVVPTVVALPELPAGPREPRTVAWIGSHSTGEFLERILPALATIRPPVHVEALGAELEVPPGLSATVRPWSPAAEDEVLARASVGVYPIDRSHPLAEGKCGFKAILYLASGVAPVVTPTTTNAVVVEHGLHGLHAEDDTEWSAAVASLLDDAPTREALAAAGRARVAADYSVGVWAARLVERLAEASRSRTSRPSSRKSGQRGQ